MKTTLVSIAKEIRTEADAYSYMETLRWPKGPICPHCGSIDKHYFLTPKTAEGLARKTRTGSMSERRVWKCKVCRKQFSVLTGTVFHGSKVPLQTWLMVVFEMCSNKNGIAAREIERKYGVAPKTAWFMTHRLREAMKRKAPGALIGPVVVDETWFGGDPKNRHGHKSGGKKGRTEKTPIIALIDTATGEVRSKAVPTITGETLRKAMSENMDMATATLHTDSSLQYRTITPRVGEHQTVNHNVGEYVRGDVSVNRAENFFSQLKRSIDGTHHHISKAHLPRYLTEFDFRYTTREMSDAARMGRLMRQVGGRRVVYRTVAGR